MELLEHLRGDHFYLTRIKNTYDAWVRKLGSMKDHPIQVCVWILLLDVVEVNMRYFYVAMRVACTCIIVTSRVFFFLFCNYTSS